MMNAPFFPSFRWCRAILLLVFAFARCCTVSLSAQSSSLQFIENKGQWDSHIYFRSDLPRGGVLFLEKDGWVIDLIDRSPRRSHGFRLFKNEDNAPSAKRLPDSIQEHFSYKMLLKGSSCKAIEGEQKQRGYVNYYLGKDQSRWRSRVASYESVVYRGVYANIDLKLFENNGHLKYDFVIYPNGNPSDVAFVYEGIDKIRLEGGRLIVSTPFTDIVEDKPFAYQVVLGDTISVPCSFRLDGQTVRFSVGNYDVGLPLIIDPQLVFSSYTGSTADNWGFAATYDSKGNAYAGGIAASVGYPTTLGAYQTTWKNAWDVAVMKFSPDGTQQIYASYLGSSGNEIPHSMIVNDFEELILFGTTGGNDFPTTAQSYDSVFHGGTPVLYDGSINFESGSDIFISKFSADGSQLIASTYLGGSDNDGLNYRQRYNINPNITYLGNDSLYANYADGARGEIITDDQNNIYIGSCTFSTDFPVTPNAFQPHNNGKQEGVVCKLNRDLEHLIFSSFLGGSEDDAIFSIDTDSQHELFVTGGTVSRDFPTTSNAFQTNHAGGATDAFVSRISYGGNALLASSYFGSPAFDLSFFVRVDHNDCVYLYGQTKASGSTLVHGATYNIPNSGQFLVKFSHDLSQRQWSTVFGTGDGRINISPTALTVDICGRICLAGWGRVFKSYAHNQTLGTPGMELTADAYQQYTDGQDFYFMSLAPDASALNYATFLGELNVSSNLGIDHVDGGTCRFDRKGSCYQAACASCGGTSDFPTFPANVWSKENRSLRCNNAIIKFNFHDDFALADFERSPVVCLPAAVPFVNTGRGNAFHWDFGDGTSSTEHSPQHVYQNAGVYQVTLIAQSHSGCKTADTLSKKVLVLGGNNHSLPDVYTCPDLPVQIGIPSLYAPDLSITWIPSHGLTNPRISDPYATVQAQQRYQMIIASHGCFDTITQTVKIFPFQNILPFDTLKTCHSPYTLSAPSRVEGRVFHWSSNRNLTDTLNLNGDSVAHVQLRRSQWFYLRTMWNGCSDIDSVYVLFDGVSVFVSTTATLCHHSSDGTATAVASGGQGQLHYTWSTGTSHTANCQGLSSLQNPYWVTVSDDRGCHSTVPFVIQSPAPLSMITDTLNDNHCPDQCTGNIVVHAEGGTPPFHFSWNTGVSDNALYNLCPADYYCTLSDSNGCTTKDTFQIQNLNTFHGNVSFENNPCETVCVGRATATISGGVEPYHYLWSNGSSADHIFHLCSGVYSVVMTDANGCRDQQVVTIINNDIFANVHVSATPQSIFAGESTLLTATEIDNVYYRWTPSNGVVNPNSFSTLAYPESNTTYTVEIYDNNGCRHIESVVVGVEKIICGEPDIFIPNVFTPNQDGLNDELHVQGKWITHFLFMIFDRWGEKIFETTDLSQGWDGTFKNKPCLSGVYYYRLEVSCQGGKKYIKGGDVTLIR